VDDNRQPGNHRGIKLRAAYQRELLAFYSNGRPDTFFVSILSMLNENLMKAEEKLGRLSQKMNGF
jgi:hypothetical protein